jgi:ferric-dicitrate binding protein FerR (iron transport regulator)
LVYVPISYAPGCRGSTRERKLQDPEFERATLLEAREWSQRLANDPSPDTRAAWRNWLAVNPLHSAAYQQVAWPRPPLDVQARDPISAVGDRRDDWTEIRTGVAGFRLAYLTDWLIVLEPNSRLLLHPHARCVHLDEGKVRFSTTKEDVSAVNFQCQGITVRSSSATFTADLSSDVPNILLLRGRAAVRYHYGKIRAASAGHRVTFCPWPHIQVMPLSAAETEYHLKSVAA